MMGYSTSPGKKIGWSLTLMILVCLATTAIATDANHLILSEVVSETHPNFDSTGSSYIQVVNPTANDILMDDVFITNGTFYTIALYYNITLVDPENFNPGGGSGGKFNARFPTGYTLAAGDSLAISIVGSTQYLTRYGRLPDFELFEDDSTAPDAVPELVEAFPGSINASELVGGSNTPELGTSNGTVILYSWDGVSDLVQDLDYLIWGTDLSVRVDKTGITIGSETYQNDVAIGSQEPVPGAGPIMRHSLRRVSADEGIESLTGGNGINGHDETSENMATTWVDINFTVDGHGVPSAPAYLFPSAPIFIQAESSPGAPYDGQEVTLTASVISNYSLDNVTFHYTVDGGAVNDLVGTNTSGDEYTAIVPVQVEGAVLNWYVTSENSEGGAAGYPSAAPTYSYEWTVREAPNPDFFPDKLLITEVATTGLDQEFVEIYNPGDVYVDMSNYYLTDANYSHGNQYYWRIAEGNPSQFTIGGGAFADFHSQFPENFTIAAGDTIVISIAGSQRFSEAFGFLPDLEVWEDDISPDTVADMRWVFGDEVNNSIVTQSGENPSIPTLSNGAETMILYHWNGESDAITDIDVFHWKDPSSTTTSIFFNKTGVTIGEHSYLPEMGTGISTSYPLEASFGQSYQRIDATEGNQISTGSNGVLGRDETSEDLQNTFELADYDPSRPTLHGSGVTDNIVPTRTALLSAYPNPFNPLTKLSFELAAPARVRLNIFDVAGRLVTTLVDEHRGVGRHEFVWNGQNASGQSVASGAYLYRLEAGDFVQTKRMMLLK